MSIADKIEEKMAALESMMREQIHLEDPSRVEALMSNISMYWAHMNDDDKDYVDCAKWALDEKREWIV